MPHIEIFSPAKINLFLAVTGKRADGYHDLVSLMAPLDFGDQLGIEIEDGPMAIDLAVDGLDVPKDESNLACKAAQLYCDTYGVKARIRIRLEKRVPIGAGLGGGSSNAAAVLSGLNSLLGKAKRDELSRIAAQIGSDCPFFLLCKPAIARSRGEILEPVDQGIASLLSNVNLLLYKPSLSISTPWAYGLLAANPACYAETDDVATLDAFLEGRIELKQLIYNTFESALLPGIPALSLMKARLQSEFGCPSLMSGSGSACFALSAPEQAESMRQVIVEAWGERCFVAQARVLE